jgi:hypothetical protein
MRSCIAKLITAAALALGIALGMAAGVDTASAQMTEGSSVCNNFLTLRNDAQQKGMAIGAAEKRHADRKDICKFVTVFAVAEGKALKFLQDNMTWCGIPPQVVTSAKENHEKTLKFRDVVCTPAPQPHVPNLSDAIGTPSVDTSKNTKTNTGTFNTLTGNPLAR